MTAHEPSGMKTEQARYVQKVGERCGFEGALPPASSPNLRSWV